MKIKIGLLTVVVAIGMLFCQNQAMAQLDFVGFPGDFNFDGKVDVLK